MPRVIRCVVIGMAAEGMAEGMAADSEVHAILPYHQRAQKGIPWEPMKAHKAKNTST